MSQVGDTNEVQLESIWHVPLQRLSTISTGILRETVVIDTSLHKVDKANQIGV